MRQRAMIAMALACNPKVLIADEPTTALDVTIQAQILELIVELQREFSAAVILITHDLGVVAETARRVIVMYAGRKVEEAEVGELFAQPLHPYTVGLLASIPRLDLLRGAGQERHRPPAGDPRHRAAAVRPAGGLRLRAALQQGRRSLPPRAAGLRTEAARPLGGLLAQQWLSQRARPRGHGPQEALPGEEGPAAPHGRPGLCRRRHQLHHRRRRDARAGGRKRLRQDHGRPRRAAPDRADLAARSRSTAPTSRRCPRRSCAPTAGRCRSSSRTRSPRSTRA